MKKISLVMLLLSAAMIFSQKPVKLSDEYHLWNGSSWNKMDYEYNSVDSTGSFTEKVTPNGTYSRYDYEGYYQLQYYANGSDGNAAWTINSHYKYDDNDYLLKYGYVREQYWMGMFDRAWGNDIFFTYLDGALSSKQEIEFDYGKEITSNTLEEFTYNTDGTINSEAYSDSTSAGWVVRSRILWSYDGVGSTGLKENYTGTEWVNSEKYERVLNENLDPVLETRSIWNGGAWETAEYDDLYYNSAGNHIKTLTYSYNNETGEYDLYSKRVLLWNDGVEVNLITGNAFLEGETDHSGIEVFFQRVIPDNSFNYTVYTNSSGYYSQIVENGVYDVSYSKVNFTDSLVQDVNCYEDNTINDMTLFTLPTGLSGSISGILEAGNYEVVGNLTVNAGDSLIIDPGVTMTFDPGWRLLVNGTLIAQGTEIDPVIFTAEPGNLWTGIIINNEDMFSRLSECIIERASVGMDIDHNQIFLDKIIFRNNNTGLKLTHEYFEENDRVVLYLSNCKFIDNNYYGIYIDIFNVAFEMTVNISNCVFKGSEAIHSSLNTFDPGKLKLKLYNCTMTGCTNVLYQDGSFQGVTDNGAYFYNCVISNNSAPAIEHVIYQFNSTEDFILEINNSCFYQNSPALVNPSDYPYIGNNLTTNVNDDPCDPWFNISMDPVFVDPGNGEYELISNSPCIDAGIDSIPGYTFPDYDINGDQRVQDGDGNQTVIVDIGAYEFALALPTTPLNFIISQSGNDMQLNWDSADNVDTYTVYSSTDPYATFPTGWTEEVSGITELTWTDTNASESKKFYVVVGNGSK